jgi:hypothetical protein
MRFNANEAVEKRECPPSVARELELAGGLNRYHEPNFRVVWGYNRIVPMTGTWEEWEKVVGMLTDKVTGVVGTREFIRLVSSVTETRQVPKYLPANCWHLEGWRPPEEYGSPEAWRKQGEEVVAGMTIDTAGEFPARGEYELIFPLTHDFTSMGQPVELVTDVVGNLVNMVRAGVERYSFVQRKAAIEQRLRREEDGFTRRTIDMLKDGMPLRGGQVARDMEKKAGNLVVLPEKS